VVAVDIDDRDDVGVGSDDSSAIRILVDFSRTDIAGVAGVARVPVELSGSEGDDADALKEEEEEEEDDEEEEED
jgi:hypothetical protein